MRRKRVPFISEAGDVCDSDFERIVIDDLIRRGVGYQYHPGTYQYGRPVQGGQCQDCQGRKILKGAGYTPDLLLVKKGVIIELKGGSMTPSSRGRLADFVKYGEAEVGVLHFLFRDNRAIYKGSKTRHVQWAEKLGCVAAVGTEVPQAWL